MFDIGMYIIYFGPDWYSSRNVNLYCLKTTSMADIVALVCQFKAKSTQNWLDRILRKATIFIFNG